MPPSDFGDLLRRRGVSFQTCPANTDTIFIMSGYAIPDGRHAGAVLDVAIQIPGDFPSTPPYGVHVKKGVIQNAARAHPSILGSDWEFWSRQMEWNDPESRTPESCMAQVNRWLEVE